MRTEKLLLFRVGDWPRWLRISIAIFTNGLGFTLVVLGGVLLFFDMPDDFGNLVKTPYSLDLLTILLGVLIIRFTYWLLLIGVKVETGS